MSVGLWSAAILLLLVGSSMPVFLLAFCGLGAGFSGYQVAAQNLVLEFGEPNELPKLIAVSDTASHLMMAMGPIIGGLVAIYLDYGHIFWLTLVFKLAAVSMVWRVIEPRKTLRRI